MSKGKKRQYLGSSLVGEWLGIQHCHGWGSVSIPGPENFHMPRGGKKKKKKKKAAIFGLQEDKRLQEKVFSSNLLDVSAK